MLTNLSSFWHTLACHFHRRICRTHSIFFPHPVKRQTSPSAIPEQCLPKRDAFFYCQVPAKNEHGISYPWFARGHCIESLRPWRIGLHARLGRTQLHQTVVWWWVCACVRVCYKIPLRFSIHHLHKVGSTVAWPRPLREPRAAPGPSQLCPRTHVACLLWISTVKRSTYHTLWLMSFLMFVPRLSLSASL